MASRRGYAGSGTFCVTSIFGRSVIDSLLHIVLFHCYCITKGPGRPLRSIHFNEGIQMLSVGTRFIASKKGAGAFPPVRSAPTPWDAINRVPTGALERDTITGALLRFAFPPDRAMGPGPQT